jgi:hypothetical protein
LHLFGKVGLNRIKLDQIGSNFEEKLKSHSEKVLKKHGLKNIFKKTWS